MEELEDRTKACLVTAGQTKWSIVGRKVVYAGEPFRQLFSLGFASKRR